MPTNDNPFSFGSPEPATPKKSKPAREPAAGDKSRFPWVIGGSVFALAAIVGVLVFALSSKKPEPKPEPTAAAPKPEAPKPVPKPQPGDEPSPEAIAKIRT